MASSTILPWREPALSSLDFVPYRWILESTSINVLSKFDNGIGFSRILRTVLFDPRCHGLQNVQDTFYDEMIRSTKLGLRCCLIAKSSKILDTA